MTWPPERSMDSALAEQDRAAAVWVRITGTPVPGRWVRELHDLGAGSEFAEAVADLASHAVAVDAAVALDAQRARPKSPSSPDAATPEALTAGVLLAIGYSATTKSRHMMGAAGLLGWLTVLACDRDRVRSTQLRRDLDSSTSSITEYPMHRFPWAPAAYAAGLGRVEVENGRLQEPDREGLRTLAALRGYVLPAVLW